MPIGTGTVLNEGVEMVLNGTAEQLPELITEVELYWKDGILIPVEEIRYHKDFKSIKFK